MKQRHRAITEEQRLTRQQELLAVAWDLFQAKDYDEISMVDIASRAGLAKGTLYLYFPSKEALFLAVEEQQLNAWFEIVEARLEALKGCDRPEEVSDAVCRSLAERPALARLLAILHVTLERNIDVETALRFKGFLLERIQAIGERIEACLPSLKAGQGVQLTLWVYASLIGLQQLADPAPVVKQALAQEPGMAAFQIDFETYCCQALRAIFSGALGLNDPD
jgi:AcrR family transcriptional regulator